MARDDGGFSEPRLGEYMAPSSLCLCQYPPKVPQCSRNRISVRKAQERAYNAVQKERRRCNHVERQGV